jgi:hypothetical protein
MARSLKPREKFLLGGLVLTAIAVLYYRSGGEGLGFAGAPASDKKQKDKPLGEAPAIHLALLDREAEGFESGARNLFDYYVPPPPPPPPQPYRPVPEVVERPVNVLPPLPKEPVAYVPPEPTPPTPAFDYLGYIGPKDAKIAVFESEEGVLLAQVGDVVEEQYRLLEFGYETVVLGYTEERFSDRTTEVKMREPKDAKDTRDTRDTKRKSKRR